LKTVSGVRRLRSDQTNALTTCRIPHNGSGHATTSTAQKTDVGIICAKSHVIFISLWLHAQ
jgi:hypothetical protein